MLGRQTPCCWERKTRSLQISVSRPELVRGSREGTMVIPAHSHPKSCAAQHAHPLPLPPHPLFPSCNVLCPKPFCLKLVSQPAPTFSLKPFLPIISIQNLHHLPPSFPSFPKFSLLPTFPPFPLLSLSSPSPAFLPQEAPAQRYTPLAPCPQCRPSHLPQPLAFTSLPAPNNCTA